MGTELHRQLNTLFSYGLSSYGRGLRPPTSLSSEHTSTQNWSDMERYGIPWTNSQSVVKHLFRYAEEKREEPTGWQALWTWKILQFTRFQNIVQGREQLLYNLVQRFVTNELQILLNQTLTETREN